MNAFFEFLKWFIKLSLIATGAVIAAIALVWVGRASVKSQAATEVIDD